MNQQKPPKRTPNDRIAIQARIWRAVDKDLCRDREDVAKKDAEYMARQQLRSVIDETVGA